MWAAESDAKVNKKTKIANALSTVIWNFCLFISFLWIWIFFSSGACIVQFIDATSLRIYWALDKSSTPAFLYMCGGGGGCSISQYRNSVRNQSASLARALFVGVVLFMPYANKTCRNKCTVPLCKRWHYFSITGGNSPHVSALTPRHMPNFHNRICKFSKPCIKHPWATHATAQHNKWHYCIFLP